MAGYYGPPYKPSLGGYDPTLGGIVSQPFPGAAWPMYPAGTSVQPYNPVRQGGRGYYRPGPGPAGDLDGALSGVRDLIGLGQRAFDRLQDQNETFISRWQKLNTPTEAPSMPSLSDTLSGIAMPTVDEKKAWRLADEVINPQVKAQRAQRPGVKTSYKARRRQVKRLQDAYARQNQKAVAEQEKATQAFANLAQARGEKSQEAMGAAQAGAAAQTAIPMSEGIAAETAASNAGAAKRVDDVSRAEQAFGVEMGATAAEGLRMAGEGSRAGTRDRLGDLSRDEAKALQGIMEKIAEIRGQRGALKNQFYSEMQSGAQAAYDKAQDLAIKSYDADTGRMNAETARGAAMSEGAGPPSVSDMKTLRDAYKQMFLKPTKSGNTTTGHKVKPSVKTALKNGGSEAFERLLNRFIAHTGADYATAYNMFATSAAFGKYVPQGDAPAKSPTKPRKRGSRGRGK